MYLLFDVWSSAGPKSWWQRAQQTCVAESVGKEGDELDEEGGAVRAEPLLRGGGSVGEERGGPEDGAKDTRGARGAEGAAEEGAPESLEVSDDAEV